MCWIYLRTNFGYRPTIVMQLAVNIFYCLSLYIFTLLAAQIPFNVFIQRKN